MLTAGLHAVGYLSSQSQSLLRGLLVRDPTKRLGSGPDGSQKIMDHPFFDKIDWQSLKLCQVSFKLMRAGDAQQSLLKAHVGVGRSATTT